MRAAIFRDARLHPGLERALFSERLGAPRAAWLVRAIRGFAPDLLVAIDAFSTPLSLLARLCDKPGLPPLLGWVGDRFGEYAVARAPYFVAIGYTDSGLLAAHGAMRLGCEAFYLPHAANALLDAEAPAETARRGKMVFVGNPTPGRLAALARLRESVVLYGGGWQAARGGPHEVHLQRVPIEGLAAIYRAHAAVLNIRNEIHVVAGLNQRNFDPFLCGAAVVTDPQPDLERCFTPGEDVLVWREPEELDAVSARLRREPGWAQAIAERGRRRVLAEHTYAARLAALARRVG